MQLNVLLAFWFLNIFAMIVAARHVAGTNMKLDLNVFKNQPVARQLDAFDYELEEYNNDEDADEEQHAEIGGTAQTLQLEEEDEEDDQAYEDERNIKR